MAASARSTCRAARSFPACMRSSRRRTSATAVPHVPMRLQPLPEFEPFAQPVIAHDKVRYVGEALAVVLADSAGVAEDALERDRSRHRAAAGGCEPAARGAERIAAVRGQGQQRSRSSSTPCSAMPPRPSRTRPIRGARASASSGTWRCRWRRAACSPNGTRRAGGSRVSGAAKVLFFNRRMLAKQMGLAEDAIDMVENDVGGGFGARGEFYPEDFLIPFAARHVGRPVKWTEDRREHLMCVNHAREAECDVEIACARDGTILGAARPCLCRRGRLYAHQRRRRRAQYRAVHVRALSHSQHRHRRRRCC